MVQVSRLEDLPSDITLNILEYLDVRELAQLGLASKIFNDYIALKNEPLLIAPRTSPNSRFCTISNANFEALNATLSSRESTFIKWVTFLLYMQLKVQYRYCESKYAQPRMAHRYSPYVT